MATDLIDRKYVSRFAQPTFGITVHKAGVQADADADPIVSYVPQGASTALWSRSATRDSLGQYSVSLGSTETATPGLATLQWEYETDGQDQIYAFDIQVGPNAPDYDALPPNWKTIIEQVWVKFADLFDSPIGGPNLQVYVQTHFGRNRLAQLLPVALQRLNSASSPHHSYPLSGDTFPFEEWGGLLTQSLYIEVLKHLIRSYTEQPEAVLGASVARFDRRDYMQRWQIVLDMELTEFNKDLSRWRQANMQLGSVHVLVAGGAYGNIGPEVNPGGAGMAAARGYFFVGRWH